MKTNEKIDKGSPERKHQKQLWLEIFLPLALSILLIVSLAVLAVSLTTSNGSLVSQWADISLILMILPLFILTLVIIVGWIFLDWAIIHWSKSLPGFFIQVRYYVDTAAAKLQNFFNLLAKPMISMKSGFAAFEEFFNLLFPKK